MELTEAFINSVKLKARKCVLALHWPGEDTTAFSNAIDQLIDSNPERATEAFSSKEAKAS